MGIASSLKRLIRALGYDIKKSEGTDIKLYRDLYPPDSIENKRFYNIGAGKFKHPFWTNIDFNSDWYAKTLKGQEFINHDLFSMKKLPIQDNSAEIVYTSHTIEHINDKSVQYLFNEAYRILKPHGAFRITMPNTDLEYRAYRANDRHYFYWIYNFSRKKERNRVGITKPMNEASIGQLFLSHFATQASELFHNTPQDISDEKLLRMFETMRYKDVLDHCTSLCDIEIQKEHPGNHINWWNEDKAFGMLRASGFKAIHKSGYGQSSAPVLRNTELFDNTHPKISLYIEARKEKSNGIRQLR